MDNFDATLERVERNDFIVNSENMDNNTRRQSDVDIELDLVCAFLRTDAGIKGARFAVDGFKV